MTCIVEDSAEQRLYTLPDVLDRAVLGDCLTVMGKLPDQIADLVFRRSALLPAAAQAQAGPLERDGGPRGQRGLGPVRELRRVRRFTEAWLTEVRRLMKPQATLWVIGTYHNIFRWAPSCRTWVSGS